MSLPSRASRTVTSSTKAVSPSSETSAPDAGLDLPEIDQTSDTTSDLPEFDPTAFSEEEKPERELVDIGTKREIADEMGERRTLFSDPRGFLVGTYKAIAPTWLGGGPSGAGMGQTGYDDIDTRLANMLEEYKMEPTAENLNVLQKDLVDAFANRTPYEFGHPAFNDLGDIDPGDVDPYQAISLPAAEIVGLWAKDNLGRDYETIPELWDNFGADYKAENDQSKKFNDRMTELTEEGNSHITVHVSMDGKIVSSVVKFMDDELNEELRSLNNNPIIDEILGDQTDPRVYMMSTAGMTMMAAHPEMAALLPQSMSGAVVRETLPSVRQLNNEEQYNPMRVVAPFHATPTGVMFASDAAFQSMIPMIATEIALDDGIAIDKWNDMVWSYNRRLKQAQKSGTEAEQPMLSADLTVESIRDRAIARAETDYQSAYKGYRTTVHKDPYRVVDSYIRGDVMPEGEVSMPGDIAAFAGRATAQATSDFLMLPELSGRTYGDSTLPSRIIDAMFMSGVTKLHGGAVRKRREEDGNLVLLEEPLKEGELAHPLLGDVVGTNEVDYFLKTVDPLTEVYTRAFVQAMDREIAEGNGIIGRELRIIKYMLEVVGTPDNLVYMAEDSYAGGTFVAEFGEAFIRPLLARVIGEDASKKFEAGTTGLGGIVAIAAMMRTPGALEAAALGTSLAKSGRARRARRMENVATRSSKAIADGIEGVPNFDKAMSGTLDVEAADKLVRDVQAIIDADDGVGIPLQMTARLDAESQRGVKSSLRDTSNLALVEAYKELGQRATEARENAAQSKRLSQERAAGSEEALNHLLDSVASDVQDLKLRFQQELIVQQGLAERLTHEGVQNRVQELLPNASVSDLKFLEDVFDYLREAGDFSDPSKQGKLIALAQGLLNKGILPQQKMTDLLQLIGTAEGDAIIRAVLFERMSQILEGAPDKAIGDSDVDLSLKTAKERAEGTAAELSAKADELDAQIAEIATNRRTQDADGLVPERPGREVESDGTFTARTTNVLEEISVVRSDLERHKANVEKMTDREAFLGDLIDNAKFDAVTAKYLQDYVRSLYRQARAIAAAGDLTPKQWTALENAIVGKATPEEMTAAVEGAAKTNPDIKAALDIVREEIADVRQDAPVTTKSTATARRVVKAAQRVWLKADEQKRALLKDADNPVEVMNSQAYQVAESAVKEADRTVNDVRTEFGLPEDTRSLGVFDESWIDDLDAKARDPGGFEINDVGHTIISARAAVKLLKNPTGILHLNHRNQHWFIPSPVFHSQNVWQVWAVTASQRVFELLPMFRMRQRALSARLAPEIDDVARRKFVQYTHIAADFYKIWDHVAGRVDYSDTTDTARMRYDEANTMINDILTTTDQRVRTVEARYRLLPYTKRTGLHIWAAAGFSTSMLDRMLDRSWQLAQAVRLKPMGENMPDFAMDAAISSFVSDLSVIAREDWHSEKLPAIKKRVYEWLIGESRADEPFRFGNYEMNDLRGAILEAIEAEMPLQTVVRDGGVSKSERLSMFRFQMAIVQGALFDDAIKGFLELTGPRTSAYDYGMALNTITGQGQMEGTQAANRTFRVDDRVWLRTDLQAWTDWIVQDKERPVSGKAPQKRDVAEQIAGTAPAFFEPERQVGARPFKSDDLGTVPVTQRLEEGDAPPIRRDMTIEQLGAEHLNKQPFQIVRMYTTERPKTDVVEGEGVPLTPERVRELAVATDTERVLIDVWDPNTGTVVKGLGLDEIAHRNANFSLLDAYVASEALGMAYIDSVGRSDAGKDAAVKGNVRKLTDLAAEAFTAYQKLITVGLAGDGYLLQQFPASGISDLAEIHQKMGKEIDQLVSADLATGSKSVMLRYMANGMGSSVLDKLLTMQRALFAQILFGYGGRPSFVASILWGDMGQKHIVLGLKDAIGLSAFTAMGYLPFNVQTKASEFLKANGTSGGVPGVLDANTNAAFLKLMEGGDTFIPELKMTAGEALVEMRSAGVEDQFVNTLSDAANKDAVRRMVGMRGYNVTDGVIWFGKAGASAGVPLFVAYRWFQDVISEATTRQRAFFYLLQRMRGKTPDEARGLMNNALFDWTTSISKLERDYLASWILFYTLQKNAVAHYLRMFTEHSRVGGREWAKRYARGSTQLQRHKGHLLLHAGTPPISPEWDGEQPTGEDLKREWAKWTDMPNYIQDMPIVGTGVYPEHAIELQRKEGYFRPAYADTLRPFSDVQTGLMFYHLATAMISVGVSTATMLAPDGTKVPLATNPKKAKELAADVVLELMAPVYASAGQALAKQSGLTTPGSWGSQAESRKVKKGDLAMYEFLTAFGFPMERVVYLQDQTMGRGNIAAKGERRIGFVGPIDPVFDMLWQLGTRQFGMYEQLAGLVFAGMTPEEVLQYASEDPTGFETRLQTVRVLMDLMPRRNWDPSDQVYYTERDISLTVSNQKAHQEQVNRSKAIASLDTDYSDNIPTNIAANLDAAQLKIYKANYKKLVDWQLSDTGQAYFALRYGPTDGRITDEFKSSPEGQELLELISNYRDDDKWPSAEIDALIGTINVEAEQLRQSNKRKGKR